MVAKLIALVVALGVTGAGLLSVRQQRLQAVSDMATAIERAGELDRRTWRFRAEIGERLHPGALRARLAALGEFRAIVIDRAEVICLPEEMHGAWWASVEGDDAEGTGDAQWGDEYSADALSGGGVDRGGPRGRWAEGPA